MAMSKKHYKAIATILNEQWRLNGQTQTGQNIIINIVNGLCPVFNKDNPKFNYVAFRDACYEEVEKGMDKEPIPPGEYTAEIKKAHVKNNHVRYSLKNIKQKGANKT